MDVGGQAPLAQTEHYIESNGLHVDINRPSIGQNGIANEREAPLLPTPPPSYEDYMRAHPRCTSV